MDTCFFDNQSLPIIIINKNKEIIYSNKAFQNIFGIVKNLEKFSKRFFFDICVINTEYIETNTPINMAVESKEKFFAQTSYQTIKNEFLNFDIQTLPSDENIIISFNDTTAKNEYINLQQQLKDLKTKYEALSEEHEKYSEIQQKAQSQAIKMALLNRFTTQIRESVDLNKIIMSALKELCTLLGGFKAYYSSIEKDKCKIKLTYPEKYLNETGKLISFDNTVNKSIIAKTAHISFCLKDYKENEETFKTQTDRIVLPIFHQSDLLGVLVVLSYQKINLSPDDDVLKAISTQLANAIVQASLFAQINTQNTKLEETLKELQETQLHLINSEKMASLGQLVAGVAHEINTPLASINSNNSILEKLIEKIETNSDNSAVINMIKEVNNIDKEAIKRISKIVVSLKQFVRLDEAELQNANINKELDLTLDLIRHETKNKVEIEKNYGEIREIKCYPNMLNQVFMNLLVNACQSIETKGKITITTIDDTKNLIIKIKDTGCGIKETDKEKIFQAGYTSKGVGVGTGLGLAITKKIIEKHNGEITFNSVPGQGTEFIVTIPVI